MESRQIKLSFGIQITAKVSEDIEVVRREKATESRSWSDKSVLYFGKMRHSTVRDA
jgi:hypothetical protein